MQNFQIDKNQKVKNRPESTAKTNIVHQHKFFTGRIILLLSKRYMNKNLSCYVLRLFSSLYIHMGFYVNEVLCLC